MLKRFLCKHHWQVIESYELSFGSLKSVEVKCNKCGLSSGSHDVKSQLSKEDIDHHRRCWQEVATGMKSLMRMIGN